MPSCLVQLRVDEKLKKDAVEVFDNLGLDLSSAIRIFLVRVVKEQGIPFSMVLKADDTEESEEDVTLEV